MTPDLTPGPELTTGRVALVAVVAVILCGLLSVLTGEGEPLVGGTIAAVLVVAIWAALGRWVA